jgi:WD40 repeat protein
LISFLSTEHAVLEYDLRQAQSPIVQDATRSLTEDFQIQEEINQLDTASPRRILAASDDMGTVRIWEEGSNLRIMQDSSHEPFLMTCCRFRSGGQIISGGTNCRLYLWDIGRPHKPLDVLTVPRQDTGVQICNPPMVHCVSWSPSGRLVAAGLGDGSIQIASVLKKKLVPLSRLQEGHADSVVSLCFPNFGAAANNDRLLASAGTDGMIILWDLDHSVGGTKATDPRRVLSEELLLGLSEVEAASQPENEPRLLFSIPHQIKANMMVSSQTNTLFVADTGKAITGYCVPLQSTSPD